MDAERWRRAEELFQCALELPIGERDALLVARCGGDVDLLELVHGMLVEASCHAAVPPPVASPPARPRIGGYQIVGEIGRGAMGVVYEAKQPRLDRSVALKVLRTAADVLRSGGTRDHFIRLASRFAEEAEVLGLLDHPGIVPILELGQEPDGVTWFTMRLIHGDDFRVILERVKRGEDGWNLTRALSVLQRVCDTLSFAHHRGVLHRDLKPSNIMVGAFGEVYLIDWGLAKVRGRPETRDLRLRGAPAARADAAGLRTIDGDVIGTPAYMAPEQAEGRLDRIGEHSDVYALGAILYQVLAGHPPHLDPGSSTDPHDVLHRVRQAGPRPLPDAVARRSRELVAICDKAMARDVAARYPTADAFGRDLHAFLADRVVSAYRTGPLAELRLWCVRNRGVAWTALLALIALLVALLVQWTTADALKAERVLVTRLWDAQKLTALVDEVDELWPADAAHVAALRDWLARAEAWVAELPEHRARLLALRQSAQPWTAADREHDRRSHPRLAELEALSAKAARLRNQREELQQRLRSASGEYASLLKSGVGSADAQLADVAQQSAALERMVGERRTWRFAALRDSWWHEQYAGLVDDLLLLADPDQGVIDGLSPGHGWGVRRRLEFAETIALVSVSGRVAADSWAQAIASIADERQCPAYRGMRVEPQLGLLPLGRDPASGLWQFWQPATGTRPTVDAQGRHVPQQEDSLVFVLIPAGTCAIGASPVAGRQNHDVDAARDEGPVHVVSFPAFFLSKYEMTQAQWRRFTGDNPSAYGPQWLGVTELHPVENLSIAVAREQMRRLGLGLPTEEQWEYAARAGSSTPWWCGEQETMLAGCGNLADQAFRKVGISGDRPCADQLDDGYGVHAPVGSFAANGFGLHDTLGNVCEWCADPYRHDAYETAVSGVDSNTATPMDAVRGGSFASLPRDARSANRTPAVDLDRLAVVGVRPCLAVSTAESE